MFRAKTVFILGAGASWHYGYPTGEELARFVRERAASAALYFEGAYKAPEAWGHRPDYVKRKSPEMPVTGEVGLKQELTDAVVECRELVERLKYVDPLVIDYFIGQNRHLEDISKLCIAWIILQSETNERHPVIRSRGNWCRFIIHKLVSGCMDSAELLNNDVTFITFNYDISLERELWDGLSSLRQFEDVANEFFTENRILHIYGKIRKNYRNPLPEVNWSLTEQMSLGNLPPGGQPNAWEQGKILFDTAFAASQGINIISPDKAETNPIVENARQAIAEAECIYILGYGFDDVNNRLLNLSSLPSDRWRTVLFTNYENHGIVNKNAGRVFLNSPNAFLQEGNQVVERLPFSSEKSINNVYNALAYDFDAPEERPHR